MAGSILFQLRLGVYLNHVEVSPQPFLVGTIIGSKTLALLTGRNRLKILYHIQQQKVLIPLIILHSPNLHILQILDLQLTNKDISHNQNILFPSGISFNNIIFLFETVLKYYKD